MKNLNEKPQTCEEQIHAICQAFLFFYQETNTGCRNPIISMTALISEIETILQLSRYVDEEER